MLRISIFMFLLFSCKTDVFNQNDFTGEFRGEANGDPVRLSLKQSGSSLSGTMEDSQQKYQIEGEVKGREFSGKATEQSLGIVFDLYGKLSGASLNLTMVLDLLGTKQEMKIDFTRSNAETSDKSLSQKSVPESGQKTSLPSGASQDPALVGTWTRSENYNSGYGDNFMGASFEESITFLADGGLSDAGSRAGMSGSHYSGSSESSGSPAKIEGARWYNIGNQLYIAATQNGKTETAHLGKYYIENGAMLITAPNGSKSLLTKR